MKKTLCLIFVFTLLTALLAACGAGGRTTGGTDPADAPASDRSGSERTDPVSAGTDETQTDAEKGEAKEFTAKVRLESDFVEFCLPEDHDGAFFTDMGVNCAISIDRYGNDVVAYHEYDKYGTVEKKTVGEYTFDYQKFNYMDLPDWRMYVIRIVRNHEYYRFVYNVYSAEYDDQQVEKFMETIRFFSFFS